MGGDTRGISFHGAEFTTWIPGQQRNLLASQLAYGTSEAAFEAAPRAIAHEAGPLGITIYAVAPGAM